MSSIIHDGFKENPNHVDLTTHLLVANHILYAAFLLGEKLAAMVDEH